MEMVRNSGFGCFFIIIENFISKFGRFGIRVYLRSSLVHVLLNDLVLTIAYGYKNWVPERWWTGGVRVHYGSKKCQDLGSSQNHLKGIAICLGALISNFWNIWTSIKLQNGRCKIIKKLVEHFLLLQFFDIYCLLKY